MRNISGIKAASCWVLLVTMLGISTATAQTVSNAHLITGMPTGWGYDAFGIQTAGQPLVNPANCPDTDQYIVDSSSPGYKTYYAAALMALAAGKAVSVVVNNTQCSANRPMIMGVFVYP
ncbi:MAG: hypothetical protein OSB41_04805 [Kiritimatiellae bacterium]|nr:hypothetical protein [Kiritimatiellia bacterium]